MPIGELIAATLGEMIGYIFIELIIGGIVKFYYWIRKILTGKERPLP